MSFSKALEIKEVQPQPKILTDEEKHLQMLRKYYVKPTYEYEFKAMNRLYAQISKRLAMRQFPEEAIEILSTNRRSVSLQHKITMKSSKSLLKADQTPATEYE